MIPIFLIVFFGFMLIAGLPIAGAILLSAFMIPLLMGSGAPLEFLAIAEKTVTGAVANNTGLTIVLFMVAGGFMARGKLTEKIFDTFSYFFGKKKGFMPIVSIVTCMFYGAISGSGPATTAAVGSMCYPVLVAMGYDKIFSASILVSAGCLGMVIPPSVPLTGVSALTGGMDVVALYKIAAVAGVAAGILLIAYAYLHCLKYGNGNQVVINQTVNELRQRKFSSLLKESIWALLTPILILGSIFSGIADTAQAAVLSLVYSIFVSIFIYKTIRPQEVLPMFRQCIVNAAPLCFVLAVASVFSAAMSALEIPAKLAETFLSSGISGSVLILLILAFMLILGAFMDAGGAMSIIVPLVYPVLVSYGMDPYTCCVAIIICQAVGLCSPLCGLCLFVMSPIAGCTIGQLGKKVIPLSGLLVLVAVIVALLPGLFGWATSGAIIP